MGLVVATAMAWWLVITLTRREKARDAAGYQMSDQWLVRWHVRQSSSSPRG